MINQVVTSRLFIGRVAIIAILAMVSLGAWAQDTTTSTTRHRERSYDIQVRNAEVVYVEGNDLVLKFANGKVEHLVVPDSDKFKIDGKYLSVHDLIAGTKLTQTITTTTAPRDVTTVRTLKGKVWHVSAPNSVIVTLPDHTNQRFEIPKNAKFFVDGKEKTAFDLRKGMTFTATVVTDSGETVVSQEKRVTGFVPLPKFTPQVSVLLFHGPGYAVAPADAPVETASAEPPAETLPKTGSVLPLVGLLGGLSLAGSFGLKAIGKKVTN
jgi:hypothetical protein